MLRRCNQCDELASTTQEIADEPAHPSQGMFFCARCRDMAFICPDCGAVGGWGSDTCMNMRCRQARERRIARK